MCFRRVLLCLGLILLAQALQSQQSADSDDIKTSLRSCRAVELTLQTRAWQRASGDVPGDDEFTAAGDACSRLNRAIATSDPSKIQDAANTLRPMLSLLGLPPSTAQEQLGALEKKTSELKGKELFENLDELAKRAFDAGEMEKAKAYSKELLKMAQQYPKDWNYGNAIFYGNFVLGRIAIQRGDLKQASQYLLAAGGTPGSPQLDSFGPNMTLAKELLEKGESGVVLQYFALCRNFWKDGTRQLDEWTAAVRGGEVPNFGRSLRH
jgi:hypothetical protein